MILIGGKEEGDNGYVIIAFWYFIHLKLFDIQLFIISTLALSATFYISGTVYRVVKKLPKPIGG